MAPTSWKIRQDVDEGRQALNFSDWDAYSGQAEAAIRAVQDGSMPPSDYTRVHGSAKLTQDEADTLLAAPAADGGLRGLNGQSEEGPSTIWPKKAGRSGS